MQCLGNMKIAIFGGTGFIGSYLTEELKKRNISVLIFSRKKTEHYFWDPNRELLDSHLLENLDVVINLVGESIQGFWTQSKKEKMRHSRLHTTEFLVEQILQLKNPPQVYIGASAVGYYGDARKELLTEQDLPGTSFLAKLTKDWEARSNPLKGKMRVVLLRFGVVMAEDKGMLAITKKLFYWFLGTQFGSGKQMMSWISIDDAVEAILQCIFHQDLSGPINLVSPSPITHQQFVQLVAKSLHRPYFSLSKKWTQRIFGESSSLFLSDLHVYPKKLLENQFCFKYLNMDEVLKKYLHIKE